MSDVDLQDERVLLQQQQREPLVGIRSTPSLSPPLPTLRPISTSHHTLVFAGIVFGNCVVSGVICLNLWAFANVKNLSVWEKRVFNTGTLLLSAALGFGIGFLCDRIGLLARGKLLQSRANSIDDIGSIVKGSLSEYTSVFIRAIIRPAIPQKPNSGPIPLVVFVIIYLILSILGRFSVAFLGFAYNMEENQHHRATLYRPDWVNLTLADGMDINNYWLGSGKILDSTSAFVEATRSPPLLRRYASIDVYTEANFEHVVNVSQFLAGNPYLDMAPRRGSQGVLESAYRFQDVRESKPEYAAWKASAEVRCKRYNLAITRAAQRTADGGWNQSKLTTYVNNDGKKVSIAHLGPTQWQSRLRWVAPVYPLKRKKGQNAITYTYNTDMKMSEVPKNQSVSIWLLAITRERLGRQHRVQNIDDRDVPIVTADFIANTPLVFRCTIRFEDIATSTASPSAFDSEILGPNKESKLGPDDRNVNETGPILGSGLYDYLRCGPARGHDSVLFAPDSAFGNDGKGTAYGRDIDYPGDELFHYAIGRQNKEDSEMWLAYYIANNIGIKLGYLNQILRRIAIQHEEVQEILTTLEVKWLRVAGILGGLLLFQIVFAAVVMLYCHGSMELLDEVPVFSDMFGKFPYNPALDHSAPQSHEGEEYGGRFVAEAGGYRWQFEKKLE